MMHKLVVFTEKGKPDSLTRPVQILFTLTSEKLKGPAHLCEPLARETMLFEGDADASEDFDWEVVWANRNVADDDEVKEKVTRPELTQDSSIKPIVCAPSIAAPIDLMLQAYAVNVSKIFDTCKIRPRNLTRPLFPVPVRCKDLPESSIWNLYQDFSGRIRLSCHDQKNLTSPTVETLAKSISELQNQLWTVFKTLSDSQARLAAVEETVSGNQGSLMAMRRDLVTAQQRLERLDRSVPAVEAEAADLKASFAGMEDRVVVLEESAESARSELVSGRQVTEDIRTQLSALHQSVGMKIGQVLEGPGVVENVDERSLDAVATRPVEQSSATDSPPAAENPPLSTQGSPPREARPVGQDLPSGITESEMSGIEAGKDIST